MKKVSSHQRIVLLTSVLVAALTISVSASSFSEVAMRLHVLSEHSSSPVAQNLEFVTYKNVSYTGQFSAHDPENEAISFQIIDKPARGSIEISESGNEFVYTPYENKTGKDSFSYIAIDSSGNRSLEAEVNIKIQKPDTKVSYADMVNHPAHNAAIRLAAEDIYIGAYMDGAYYFQPNQTVSRSEFLVLAMATVDIPALEGVAVTGFFDDDAIAVWAKPYVSSALKSGMIQGSIAKNGEIVFRGSDTITLAEASVILNRMLSVTDVSADLSQYSEAAIPTWVGQAVENLASVNILNETQNSALEECLTRADVAEMLAGALNLIEQRK